MARRDTQAPNALIAAARRVPLADGKLAKQHAARAMEWQNDAWVYFDEVPEVHQSVRYRAEQVAKVKLYVAAPNPEDPDGDPIPVSDPAANVPPGVATAATAELARLRSRLGGQANILRQLDKNLEVAGECYLIGMGERPTTITLRDGTVTQATEPEDWSIRSISEVEVKSNGRYVVKDEGDPKGTELDPERDTAIRIWTQHPRFANKADSPMRALLGECRVLTVLTQKLQANAMRSLSAGFVTIPNELSFGPVQPQQSEDADGGADKGDPLHDVMHDVLVRPIEDPSDPSTVQPGILRGPAEFLKPEYVRRLTFYDPDQDAALEEKIKARVTRIARGLNLPVERVLDLKETTFANAAQVDKDEYSNFLGPSVDAATDVLTFSFLQPQLLENPDVPEEWARVLTVQADPSALISEPDTEANADAALASFAISLEAYRKAKGYSEDDAMLPEDQLAYAGLRRGIFTADLTLALLSLLGEPIDVVPIGGPPEGEPTPVDPNADARSQLVQLLVSSLHQRQPLTPPPPRAITAAARPDYGRELADLDRDLRTRLVVAANDAMGRALDKAASRLRSRSNGTEHRATIRNVPARATFAHLGRSVVADVFAGDDPLEGAWDELERQFMAWGASAQAEALDVASRVSAGFTASERSALQLRQADDLGEAWAWMRAALASLAGGLMFDPDPAAPELGEFDPTLKVPTGLVRQALARAGGATGLITEDGGAWVALTDGGTRAAGGIGTGELLRGAMRDAGALVEAYRWVYGPAYRSQPFEPHRRLDGVTFRNFDDPVLANGSGWPPYAYFLPGDHAGCVCDAAPVIVPVEELTT